MEAVHERAKAKKCNVYLETSSAQIPAIKLYEKMGYDTYYTPMPSQTWFEKISNFILGTGLCCCYLKQINENWKYTD